MLVELMLFPGWPTAGKYRVRPKIRNLGFGLRTSVTVDLSASQGPAYAFHNLGIMITSKQAHGTTKIKGSVGTEIGPERPLSPRLPIDYHPIYLWDSGKRTHPSTAHHGQTAPPSGPTLPPGSAAALQEAGGLFEHPPP